MPTLRDYQSADIETLKGMPFALIGHEQGLGKTIIASQLCRIGTIIVCPTSVTLNWQRELGIWRPELKTQVLKGRDDSLANDTEVVIMPYSLVDHVELPGCFTLIVDESHYVKNREAIRSQRVALYAKYADRVYLMSGTPFPNRPRELWTQLRMLRATDMSYSAFTNKFADAHQGERGWDDSGASNLDELRELVNTVMIRREKADVLKELPPKQHQIIPVEGLGEITDEEVEMADAIRRHGLSSHTVSFDKLSEYRRLTGERKVDAVINHVRSLLDTGVKKVVLFAHHKDVINAYHDGLDEYGVVQVTGDTNAETRQIVVDRFQEEDSVRVFIGNIQAAGVGITLTAASVCVFGEIDWVPGNMAQASDRLHRIGQTDSVLVQYVVTSEGLDHRLMESLLEKDENIKQVIKPTEVAT